MGRNKPVIKIATTNGNIFAVLGVAKRALTKNSQSDKIKEMFERVTDSENYWHALSIIEEYVDFE